MPWGYVADGLPGRGHSMCKDPEAGWHLATEQGYGEQGDDRRHQKEGQGSDGAGQ